MHSEDQNAYLTKLLMTITLYLIIGLLEEECYNAKTMPYTETIFR